jgi:colicin import membrane protein
MLNQSTRNAMADQKESSVLFSLKELMSLEEDRIKQEADNRKRKEASELQARADAERRAREAEEARVAAEGERRRQEDQRQREEQARVEAIRQAEAERVHANAESEARLRETQQKQEHERKLAALSQDKKKKQLTYISVGIGTLLIAGAVGAAVVYKESEHRRLALLEEQNRTNKALAEQKEAIVKLQNDLDNATKAVAVAEENARKATSDDERKAAEAEREKAVAALKHAKKDLAAMNVKPAAPATPAPACTCQKGDPMCPCL